MQIVNEMKEVARTQLPYFRIEEGAVFESPAGHYFRKVSPDEALILIVPADNASKPGDMFPFGEMDDCILRDDLEVVERVELVVRNKQ